MITLTEACDVLHVDQGNNDELIQSLCLAIPPYIETTTGLTEDQQDDEPLVKTVAGLLLTQWYYMDKANDESLTRTINALLKAISARYHHAE